MEAEFVPYEQALALKELGFDEPCFNYYDGDKNKNSINLGNGYVTKYMVSDNFTITPLYQQAFRWFREKYDIICHPERWGQNLEYACKFDLYDKKERKLGHIRNEDNTLVSFKTYKEAELECLKKLIQIVKEQK